MDHCNYVSFCYPCNSGVPPVWKKKEKKIRFPVDGIRDGADESNLHAVKCDV